MVALRTSWFDFSHHQPTREKGVEYCILVFLDDVVVTTFVFFRRVLSAPVDFTVANGSLASFLGHDWYTTSP